MSTLYRLAYSSFTFGLLEFYILITCVLYFDCSPFRFGRFTTLFLGFILSFAVIRVPL